MNDNSGLGTVRDSLTAAKGALTETHMNTPLDAIVRRGRATLRRRRLMGLTGTAAVAASAALVVGLTGITGAAPAHDTGTIRTAAFTLVSHANGTVTLTISSRVVFDPGVLQRDLAHDGIPAKVTVGSFCFSRPAPAGLSQVVSFDNKNLTMTIRPSAMPAGTELSFGIRRFPHTYSVASIVLIKASSYTCN